ncbi:hypothetical protein AAEP80_04260 [Curtobacterium sp. L3-7]|uniref:TetR/AcrR family transcriptional regulator n=1 Tax=Curtobacterium sp. L3-7 TaxID=3138787 RepID=UPI003B528EC1
MTSAAQGNRRRELAATDDPRAARTRDRLVAALDALLEAGEAVSVAAVCTRAGVGRSTFYTHFATVGDVVVYVVDTMFDEIGPRDVSRRTGQVMARAAITRTGLEELLAAFRLHRRYLLYAVSAPATERVREHLVEEMSASLRRTILTERPDASDEFLDTAGEYIAGGVLSVLLGWLESPRGRSDDDIVDTVAQLLPSWLTTND